jgi:hypothetical protein
MSYLRGTTLHLIDFELMIIASLAGTLVVRLLPFSGRLGTVVLPLWCLLLLLSLHWT